MANIEEFGTEQFNVKDWVNAAAASKPADEPLDRFLAELEMRLQLSCEDLELALEDCSAQVLRRIPLVMQEVSKIKSETDALRGSVNDLVGELKNDHTQATEAVSGIMTADRVKTNMEAACNTLREATELSDLFIRVDSIFAQGNVKAMADALSTMRRSLALVGNVPDFKGGNEKLKVLEDSLVARIEPRLADALSKRQAEEVKELAGLLLNVDHFSTLEKVYAATRSVQLRSAKEALKTGLAVPSLTVETVGSALSTWHDSLLVCVEGEVQWCDSVLPDYSSKLVTKMLKTGLQDVNSVLQDILHRASILQISIFSQQLTLAFFHTLARALATVADLTSMTEVASLLFEPFESDVDRYVVLEKEALVGEIRGVGDKLGVDLMGEGSPTAGTRGVDSIVAEISKSVELVFGEVDMAVDRCMAFTGGTELGSLLPAVDSGLNQYFTVILLALRVIRKQALGQQTSDVPEERGSEMASVLQLLRIQCHLEKWINTTKKKMQDAIVGLGPKLREAEAEGNTNLFDLTTRRLQKSAGLRESLSSLISAAHSTQFAPISSSERAYQGFSAAVEALVFDVLMDKLRKNFEGMSAQPDWGKVEATGTAVSLPQFSTYPQHYVTSSGEYLMMLPQQLEALVGGEGEEQSLQQQEEELAAVWLDKIVSGAAELYVDEILQIHSLSQKGGVQLATDVEYFSNILSAMGFPQPEDLSTIEKALGMDEQQLQAAEKEASGELGGRGVVTKSIAKMRGADPLGPSAGQ